MTATPTPDDGAAGCTFFIVKINPCPFCQDENGEVAESDTPSIHGGKKHAVYCGTCFCEGPPAETQGEAIAAWNTRSPAPVSGEAAERAAEAVAQWMCKKYKILPVGESKATLTAIIRQHCAGAGREGLPAPTREP